MLVAASVPLMCCLLHTYTTTSKQFLWLDVLQQLKLVSRCMMHIVTPNRVEDISTLTINTAKLICEKCEHLCKHIFSNVTTYSQAELFLPCSRRTQQTFFLRACVYACAYQLPFIAEKGTGRRSGKTEV